MILSRDHAVSAPEAVARSARPLNILQIIDSLDIGGAQRLLEMQLGAMAGGPHTVRVINLKGPSTISRRLGELGFEVVDIDQTRLIEPGNLRTLYGLARSWRPDVIHAHLNHGILLGAAFSKLLRAPLVVTLHSEGSFGAHGASSKMKARLEHFALTHVAALVVACGPRVAAAQRPRIGKTPMITVVNRVNPPAPLAAERSAIRSTLGYGPEDFIAIAVGRPTPEKGFDLLVDAFAAVRAKHPNAHLLVVGEGAERELILGHIRRAGLGDAVHMLGARSDVDRIMAGADLFVLSSRLEGLPLVLLEAMAAGLAIIATQVGDVGTVTAGGEAALLVPPRDAPALSDAILAMIESPEKRASFVARAREAALPYIDVNGFVDEMVGAYRTALGEAAPTSRTS